MSHLYRCPNEPKACYIHISLPSCIFPSEWHFHLEVIMHYSRACDFLIKLQPRCGPRCGLEYICTSRKKFLFSSCIIFKQYFITLGNTCTVYTGQRKHYPPANHHAIYLEKCSISGLYNHLLATSADDPSLIIARALVKGHQHQWVAGGYDLEIGHF